MNSLEIRKKASTLFAHTYDGCLLPPLAAIMVFGSESIHACQQEGPIFFFSGATQH